MLIAGLNSLTNGVLFKNSFLTLISCVVAFTSLALAFPFYNISPLLFSFLSYFYLKILSSMSVCVLACVLGT